MPIIKMLDFPGYTTVRRRKIYQKNVELLARRNHFGIEIRKKNSYTTSDSLIR